jgi:hypothetical protein
MNFGPFDDVPDTVKEEYPADQTCLQNSQAAIHSVPCQDCLLVNETVYLLSFKKMKYSKIPLI